MWWWLARSQRKLGARCLTSSLIAAFAETHVVGFHLAAVERLDPRIQRPSVEIDRVDVGPTTALASLVGFVFV